MFAITLEQILLRLLAGSDFSPVDREDISRRFESLRSYGRLPAGRENRAVRLTPLQVGSAVLGLVPRNPAWAGHAATVLNGLLPVGGPEVAYSGARSLGALLECLLTDAATRSAIQYLSVSMTGRQGNMGGLACLVWGDKAQPSLQGYVPSTAVSLLDPRGAGNFNSDAAESLVRRDFRLTRQFFEELAEQMKWSLSVEAPIGGGSEYDADDARRARLERLGVRPHARYLNVGVEAQVSWPKTETVISFEGRKFIVMPPTASNSASVHIDLHTEKIDDRHALTLINRLLSLMAWEDDAFAICRDGWSGNPVPVAVPRRNLANSVTPFWLRPLTAPASERVRRAVGYYREGLNADEAELISFSVLSYLKVIEIKFPEDSKKLKRWIGEHYENSLESLSDDPRLKRFDAARGGETPETYIWKACRVAVAHASENYPSDSDDMEELTRLSVAAYVLRRLARRMIDELRADADDQCMTTATATVS